MRHLSALSRPCPVSLPWLHCCYVLNHVFTTSACNASFTRTGALLQQCDSRPAHMPCPPFDDIVLPPARAGALATPVICCCTQEVSLCPSRYLVYCIAGAAAGQRRGVGNPRLAEQGGGAGAGRARRRGGAHLPLRLQRRGPGGVRACPIGFYCFSSGEMEERKMPPSRSLWVAAGSVRALYNCRVVHTLLSRPWPKPKHCCWRTK